MLVRALAIALCLASAAVPAYAVTPAVAPLEAAESMTVEELMTATALDQIFNTFAETIASSPEAQGVRTHDPDVRSRCLRAPPPRWYRPVPPLGQVLAPQRSSATDRNPKPSASSPS